MEKYYNNPNNIRLRKIIEHLGLTKPGSKFVAITGQQKGNVSTFINSKKPAPDSFIEDLYNHYGLNDGIIGFRSGTQEESEEPSEFLDRLKLYAHTKKQTLNSILEKSSINIEELSHINTCVIKDLLLLLSDLDANWLFTDLGDMLKKGSIEGGGSLKMIELLENNIETQKSLIGVYEDKIRFLENQVTNLKTRVHAAE